jgi:hypothetical protein
MALHILKLGDSRGWVVNFTPCHFSPGGTRGGGGQNRYNAVGNRKCFAPARNRTIIVCPVAWATRLTNVLQIAAAARNPTSSDAHLQSSLYLY